MEIILFAGKLKIIKLLFVVFYQAGKKMLNRKTIEQKNNYVKCKFNLKTCRASFCKLAVAGTVLVIFVRVNGINSYKEQCNILTKFLQKMIVKKKNQHCGLLTIFNKK